MNKVCLDARDVVLITGASKGIGFACAQQALLLGAQILILTARNNEALLEAKQQLSLMHPAAKIYAWVCDHSDAQAIAKLQGLLGQHALLPTKIIANVGVNPVHEQGPKKMASTSPELLQTAFVTNVVNMHLLLAPLLKRLQRQQDVTIVLVGSQAYLWGVKGQLAYNVSKAALVGYKNTLVSEYGAKSIVCHLLNPGMVANQRSEKLLAQLGREHSVSEAEVGQAVANLLLQQEKNGLEINL